MQRQGKLINKIKKTFTMADRTSIIEYSESNTIEQNALLWAEHDNKMIRPGHGLFINFKQTPELEKPFVNFIILNYGWVKEKPFFLRKPKYLFRHNINLN